MRDWIRRIKGTLGMGLTWAAGWMPIGAIFGLALWVVGLDPLGPGQIWWGAKLFGVLGFFGGSIFSAVLRLAEGRRRFDQLSLPRFAVWGGVGGLLLGGLALIAMGGPALKMFDLVGLSVTTLLGSASAAGTLAIARRAEDQELLAASTDVAEVGVTEQETKQLLGSAG